MWYFLKGYQKGYQKLKTMKTQLPNGCSVSELSVYPSDWHTKKAKTSTTDKFLLEGQRLTSDKKTKWKVIITPVNTDLHFVQEVSVNDGPCGKNANFMYKRIQ